MLFLGSPTAVEADTVTFCDSLGRTVHISVPVSRAVIFQTYELIPALGIWHRVVGVGRSALDNDLMMAAAPDAARELASAGSGVDVNIEALLSLKPDLVITWAIRPGTVRFIEGKGLNVIGVSPDNLAGLYEVMRLHGKLFDKANRVEAVIEAMEKVFTHVRTHVSGIPFERRKKILWLYGKPTQVAAGMSIPDSLITLAGGINPAAGIPRTSAHVSLEQIVAWNPDVIFIWGYAGYSAESLLESTPWQCIKAVREGQVHKAPRWSNWSPRIAPVALWMAMTTYPDLFKGINAERSFDGFYQEVYGIPYAKVRGFDG